jgi:hypothetical protein
MYGDFSEVKMQSLTDLQLKLKNQMQKKEKKKDVLPSKIMDGGTYQKSGKKKVTFYLTQNHESMLNEIYTMKIMMGEKVDKSTLICQAVELMFRNVKGD